MQRHRDAAQHRLQGEERNNGYAQESRKSKIQRGEGQGFGEKIVEESCKTESQEWRREILQ